ncbi:MAG: hypothetical protein ACKO96_11575, partial [Flammeovirgaceae bacterium]
MPRYRNQYRSGSNVWHKVLRATPKSLRVGVQYFRRRLNRCFFVLCGFCVVWFLCGVVFVWCGFCVGGGGGGWGFVRGRKLEYSLEEKYVILIFINCGGNMSTKSDKVLSEIKNGVWNGKNNLLVTEDVVSALKDGNPWFELQLQIAFAKEQLPQLYSILDYFKENEEEY